MALTGCNKPGPAPIALEQCETEMTKSVRCLKESLDALESIIPELSSALASILLQPEPAGTDKVHAEVHCSAVTAFINDSSDRVDRVRYAIGEIMRRVDL